jgi:hypothetical protein
VDGDEGAGLALFELPVVEQRYSAVLAVERGELKIVVAARFGVSRQTFIPGDPISAVGAGRVDGPVIPAASGPYDSADAPGHPRWTRRRIVHEPTTALENTTVVSVEARRPFPVTDDLRGCLILQVHRINRFGRRRPQEAGGNAV